MKIYDVYGVNYFMEYIKFTSRYYGGFSKGINKWIQDFSKKLMMPESQIIEYDYWFSTYCEYLEEICTTLKFFEFEHYDGVILTCLQTLLKEAPKQKRLKLNKIMKQHEVETQLRIESKIEKYFNLPLETVHITNTNRKYTTLKQACFAYRKSENIPRKDIQNAIRMYKVSSVITLPSDNIVYDKIELEKAVQKIRGRHI